MQNTSTILMVRPAAFGFNEETAADNSFQRKISTLTQDKIQQTVLKEFDGFADALLRKGIEVIVIDDTAEPPKSDAIFPNNWFLTLPGGFLSVFPMFAPSRRPEKRDDILQQLNNEFEVTRFTDWSELEAEGFFLEGTGSMVLDRENRIAYACISPRTDEKVLTDFCTRMKYTPVVFNATDGNGYAIYHTNVLMCVADKYVVICLESVSDPAQNKLVAETIINSQKKIIPITIHQMDHFAGNMLQVENKDGEKLLIMSTQAYESLTNGQVEELSAYNRIIHSPLTTIETNGGGSARCMMAEVYLPLATQ